MKPNQGIATEHNTPEVFCDGKRRLDRAALDALLSRQCRRTNGALRPYRCPACKGWHIGSTMTSRDKRKRPDRKALALLESDE